MARRYLTKSRFKMALDCPTKLYYTLKPSDIRDGMVAKRNLAALGPLLLSGRCCSHHIYVVSIDFDKISMTRHQFMEELAEQGIGSQVHYIPVVNHPYYQKLQYNLEALPVVKEYYKTVLSIPLYYDLSRIEVNKIVEAVCELLVGIKFDQNK